MKALIGTKIGMAQIFDTDGNAVAVTLVHAEPNTVTQIKTGETDGYAAVQIGAGDANHQRRPQTGHLKAANVNSKTLREVRMSGVRSAEAAEKALAELELKVGDKLSVTNFEVGDKVEVIGTSKGKGFAGTIKRHNFSRGPKTHGSHNYRAPGSIGSGYPEHVFKGMRMAGQMGNARVTTKNLKVVAVDEARNLLAVSGAIPGPRKGTVMVKGL